MEQNKLFATKNILTVIFITSLLVLASFTFSFWQTPDYKSSSKLLVIFNQENIDTYTASRTANYVTGILSEAVYSESFINLVFKSETKLIDNLGSRTETRQKNWKQAVKIKVLENKGIMIIDVFGKNRSQTAFLAGAVTRTIVDNHGVYDGSGDRVAIRVLDEPSIYESWAVTKIIRDTLIGLMAGLVLGLTFIIIFPNHRIFDFKSKKKLPINYYNNQPEMSRPIRQTANNYNTPSFNTKQPSKTEAVSQPQPTNNFNNQENTIKTNNPWLEEYYEENLPEKSK
jgi:capsular polysaccharide biosynthesis protein